jgi:hypothetical protein
MERKRKSKWETRQTLMNAVAMPWRIATAENWRKEDRRERRESTVDTERGGKGHLEEDDEWQEQTKERIDEEEWKPSSPKRGHILD